MNLEAFWSLELKEKLTTPLGRNSQMNSNDYFKMITTLPLDFLFYIV